MARIAHAAHMEEFGLANSQHSVRGTRPVRTRLGFRRNREGRERALNRPLPAVSSLARDLCAERGLMLRSHGLLPPGGTIVSIDDLSFDTALVLLNLFEDARIYADRAFDAAPELVSALSLRSCRQVANAPVFESIVHDLACGRVVVLSASHVHSLSPSIVSNTRVRRMYVDVSTPSAVHVLSEV